jgi:hypothetical protein
MHEPVYYFYYRYSFDWVIRIGFNSCVSLLATSSVFIIIRKHSALRMIVHIVDSHSVAKVLGLLYTV